MPNTETSGGGATLHPLHAILLAFPLALFSAGLISDIAYLRTAVIQWSNFSAWLITGALVFGGLVLAWGVIAAVFPRRSSRRRALAFLAAVAVMWLAGLINAFQHSHDGWPSVGALGLTLSILSSLFALIAAAIGYSSPSARGIVR
ncbi:DUF2231 domain-containing protein [Caulobacter hibisci]|uniref:DUF2231 domain-containing protein n=1 Tax=Caulobacter hibisci TaxID=2035993 RepID=A0ABS0SWX6_9CAUL|nr:DUF2231 domain-containing protein [Caulobacter hibisci]MBI1684145.1 hypothetical protein [Caulobacter hibisci]